MSSRASACAACPRCLEAKRLAALTNAAPSTLAEVLDVPSRVATDLSVILRHLDVLEGLSQFANPGAGA